MANTTLVELIEKMIKTINKQQQLIEKMIRLEKKKF